MFHLIYFVTFIKCGGWNPTQNYKRQQQILICFFVQININLYLNAWLNTTLKTNYLLLILGIENFSIELSISSICRVSAVAQMAQQTGYYLNLPTKQIFQIHPSGLKTAARSWATLRWKIHWVVKLVAKLCSKR